MMPLHMQLPIKLLVVVMEKGHRRSGLCSKTRKVCRLG